MRGAALRSLTRLLRYLAVLVLAIVISAGAGAAFTQTSWFKNWLRLKAVSQAAQYLNGELTIERLGGTIFTGVALDGVTLRHAGHQAVAIGRLTVAYSPLTMISEGLILDSLTLDNPTFLLERDEHGWNFNRFVKTRQNTGGRGAPPLTLASVVINNGHVIVKDRGQLVEDLTRLDTDFRFAYEKPGISITIASMKAAAEETALHSFSGDLRFDRGSIIVRRVNLRTDRSALAAALTYQGPQSRQLDLQLDAERLSLPEIGRYFRPLATIRMEPAVNVRGRGTLDALAMDVSVESPAGSASGPLVGHFGAGSKRLEGTLNVRDIDMAPILNRDQWKTRVTGRAEFAWTFSPAQIDFNFAGPQVEGFGYRAANVNAKGKYEPSVLRFVASGTAYGTRATARADFRFATATQPLTYTLDGTFRDLDMRRLPEKLSMPKLETRAAGRYKFGAAGANWQADATLDESTVENAQFGAGTTLVLESRSRALSYAANGSVAGLDPRRFAGPLDVDWLDDERFSGSLTGSFTFEGSGRAIDDLTLKTSASLVDSTLAQVGFPSAEVGFQMADREIRASFAGPFEHLPGSLFTERKELADTTLNGTADMAVTLALPKTGSVEFLGVTGTTTLSGSTIAGTTVDSGRFTGSFEHRTLDIKDLVLSGPDVSASASGSLATGEAGESKLSYELTVTNLGPIAKKFERPVEGSARVKGEATGPASNLALAGTLDANRLQYGTNFDALTATTKYTVRLPQFEIEQSHIQADTQATFVTIAGTRLPRVTAQTTYAKNDLQFEASMEDERRALGVGGNLLFHPDHDELHLRALSLRIGDTQWALPQGQEATAQYSEDSVHIENFVLQRGEQQLAVAGTVAVGPGSENLQNTLNARFDNVQIQDINQLLLGDRELSGILDASAVIRGTRNDPIVQTDFEITQGMAEGVPFSSLSGRADYSGRAVDLDARLDQSASATLTAVGTVPVPNGPGQTARTDEFDLTVKSSPIDIALLQPATTQLTKLTGQLSANLHVGGTLEVPRFNGLVETTNGGFTVAATGVAYQNAIARLIFENDRLLVDRFELTDDGRDRLVAIGQLGIVRRRVGEMNMQISADGFEVLDNQFGSLEIDTDLRVTGDAAKPQITGEIVTNAGRVEVDRLLEELTRSPYRTEAIVATQTETETAVDAAPATEEQRGIYDAATVDVRLRLPDDLVLRGRDMHASFSRIGLGDMNVTVGGELEIRKAPGGEPDVVGTVSVVRGFYDFQGRRFEVLRDSQIRFQGTRPVDPALQVDAERQINAVTAIVNIRGTARQPQVRLSSQPPLDEADVLSLIVFNQPINQLGEGERLNLAERAGSLAAGYLASPLANSIARALDLDLFEIRAGGGESDQPSIAVGQQIGSRLFVSFRQEFGSYDYTQVSLEYRINQLLRLVSTVTQGSQRSHRTQRLDTTGLDLYYTITY